MRTARVRARCICSLNTQYQLVVNTFYDKICKIKRGADAVADNNGRREAKAARGADELATRIVRAAVSPASVASDTWSQLTQNAVKRTNSSFKCNKCGFEGKNDVAYEVADPVDVDAEERATAGMDLAMAFLDLVDDDAEFVLGGGEGPAPAATGAGAGGGGGEAV